MTRAAPGSRDPDQKTDTGIREVEFSNDLAELRAAYLGDEPCGRRTAVRVAAARGLGWLPFGHGRRRRCPCPNCCSRSCRSSSSTTRICDIVNLLHHRADGVDFALVGERCAADWGLWRTTTMDVQRTAGALDDLGLSTESRERVHARVALLSAALESAPKSRRWKLRSRIGDRVRWYEDPEDVA